MADLVTHSIPTRCLFDTDSLYASQLLGTLVALAMGEQQSSLLLNFTAGGFIYVATVDVLPALLQGASTLQQTLSELAAMCAGISMMLLVLTLE